MSPELETLDQLLGGDLSLSVILDIYPDTDGFLRGVYGLLNSGDVLLLERDTVVPEWRWRELCANGNILDILKAATLSITEQGAKKIG